MCLYPKHAEIKVAKKNITVYKYLFKPDLGGRFRSPFMGHIWTIGKLETVKTKLGGNRKREVNKGLHAYTHLFMAEQRAYTNLEHYCVVKCIIPKGSIYKLGLAYEIVSNQMILKKVLE